VLIDFFYAPPVGHAIEALHHALNLQAADRTREIGLVLNAATPVELASWCPWLTSTFAIDAPFLEPAPGADASLAAIPDDWDWILDDARRHQPSQLEAFPGMRDHYVASDARLTARVRRSVVGFAPLDRATDQRLRLQLPAASRRGAETKRASIGDGPLIAFMPAGSSPRASYPSTASWLKVLDALAAKHPQASVALIGRLAQDERTATSLATTDHAQLLSHPAVSLDAFDLPLAEQLALVEAADLFLAPHTGFGMAALAVGTPWLSLAGGRWFEWYFNQVPFRSVIPDQTRFPCFGQFSAEAPIADEDGQLRIPSMSNARINADLPRLIDAAGELLAGSVSYEQCLRDYFVDLLAAHAGDPSPIWSFDDVHRRFLPAG
jgi:hypothetical protein